MEQLGRIVRLQVQVAPLKRGEKPHRWYDAERIRRVDAATITEDGVVGHLDGESTPIVDVHNRTHPESRNRGDNGVSLGVRGHYELMRGWFGDHVTDGIAGENLVIDRDVRLTVDELASGLTAVGRDGRLTLATARPIEPCVEFSRFVLRAGDGGVTEPLRRLRHGIRGFALTVAAGGGTVLREGDLVLLGARG